MKNTRPEQRRHSVVVLRFSRRPATFYALNILQFNHFKWPVSLIFVLFQHPLRLWGSKLNKFHLAGLAGNFLFQY